MFWMVLYFTFCYGLIAAAYLTIWGVRRLRTVITSIIRRARHCEASETGASSSTFVPRLRRRIGRVLWLFVLLVPLFPYAYDEVVTVAFLPGMRNAIRSALRISDLQGPVRFERVLYITGRSASVYVVAGPEHNCEGDLFELDRKRGSWRFSGDYDVIFADTGNADSDVFPPYPADGDF